MLYPSSTHKSTKSRYGFKLDESRNLWEESGLKMDSVVTDVGWGAGGGLYSSISFLFICFRDPLSPKAHCFPSSHPYASTFQSTHSSVSELILLPLLYIADF